MRNDGSDTTLLSTSLSEKSRQHWTLADLVPRSALRRTYLTLLCLHVLLIIIHLVLVAVIFAPPEGHLEHRFSIPIGPQANALQVAIVVISQVFNVAFVASSLFLIQQLALRRAFHKQQTLTAVHDRHAAWSGLGSALSTLYSQRKRATSVWGIIFVTAYLLGTTVLHITTPSLFSLATFNNTFPGIAPVIQTSLADVGSSPTTNFDNAAYILPMLDLLANTNTTIGVYENIIFDTVGEAEDSATHHIRPISAEIEVGATAFHANCGLLPQARQNGTQANTTVWNIISSLEDKFPRFIPAPIRLLTRHGIRFLPYMQGNLNTTGTQSALLYASVNVTDDQGKNGTTLQLNPPMPGVPPNFEVSPELFPDFQPVIIACSLNLTVFKAHVDPITRNITARSLPNRKVQTTWQDWQAPSLSDNSFIASWGALFNIRTLTSTPANMCAQPQDVVGENNDCQTFDYLTIAEKYINDRLGIRPAGRGIPWVSRKAVRLRDLAMALEEMTAAVYWTAIQTPRSMEFNYDPGSKPIPKYIDVRVSNPNAQLNLNLVPVFCGLAASIALLVLSIAIARDPDRTILDSELNMVGLLQFMWLLGTGSEAQSRIAEVEKPTTDNLREAAMFDVRLETLFHRGQQVEEEDP